MKKNLLFIVLASVLTIFASVFTGCNDDALDGAASYDNSAAMSRTNSSNTSLIVPWTGTFNVGTGWDIALEFTGSQFDEAVGIRVEFTTTPGLGWWKIKMTENDSSWTPLALSGTTGGMSDVTATQTSYTFTLDGANLAAVREHGLNIGGYGITITSVDFDGAEGETVLWEGINNIGTGWNVAQLVPGNLFSTPTGVKVEFTTNSGAPWWKIKMMHDNFTWTPLTGIPGAGTGSGAGVVGVSHSQNSYTFNLLGGNLNNVKKSELLIGGYALTLTKISLVPLI